MLHHCEVVAVIAIVMASLASIIQYTYLIVLFGTRKVMYMDVFIAALSLQQGLLHMERVMAVRICKL